MIRIRTWKNVGYSNLRRLLTKVFPFKFFKAFDAILLVRFLYYSPLATASAVTVNAPSKIIKYIFFHKFLSIKPVSIFILNFCYKVFKLKSY